MFIVVKIPPALRRPCSPRVHPFHKLFFTKEPSMRSFGHVRLLSIVVLGLMLTSFSQTAFAAAYARFTANGSSSTTVTALSPSVRFNSSASTPAGTTYYWDFGDGSTLTTT